MYTMLVGKYFQVFRIELLFIYSPSSVSNHHQLPSPHIIYTLFKEWRLSSLITIIFCSTSTCRHKNASAFSSLLFLRRYFTCTNYIARGGWVVGGERGGKVGLYSLQLYHFERPPPAAPHCLGTGCWASRILPHRPPLRHSDPCGSAPSATPCPSAWPFLIVGHAAFSAQQWVI